MPEDNGYGDWRDTAEEMRAEIELERYDMADWEPDGEDEAVSKGGRPNMSTGWEWICRLCGHTNRGTDSSHFCEKCGCHR
jgi:hypothetical protein